MLGEGEPPALLERLVQHLLHGGDRPPTVAAAVVDEQQTAGHQRRAEPADSVGTSWVSQSPTAPVTASGCIPSRTATWAVRPQLPFAARYQRTGTGPTAARTASPVRRRESSTCASSAAPRSAYPHPWFASACPSATTRRSTSGRARTCSPTTQNVARTPSAASTPSSASVSGAGPSSTVSAATLPLPRARVTGCVRRPLICPTPSVPCFDNVIDND